MCSGFPNGTNGIPISFKVLPMVPIGNTICTNCNANGTIGSPNGTIGTIGKPMVPLVSQWYHWLSMVPLVKLPMVPLGEPRTEPMFDVCFRYVVSAGTELEQMRTVSVLLAER